MKNSAVRQVKEYFIGKERLCDILKVFILYKLSKSRK